MSRKIEILKQDRAYDGFFKVDRYRLRQTGAAGPFEFTRELFERGSSAAILPYDPVLDRVLVVEEFRIGLLGAGYPPEECWSAGPIAGMIDPGELPLETVLREAKEEAGLDIRPTDLLCDPIIILPSPGGSSELVWLYLVQADLTNIKDAPFGMAGEGEETWRRVRSRENVLFEVLSKPTPGHLTSLMLRLESLRNAGLIWEA